VTLQEWEWFALMRRMRKPVDMVALEHGAHILQKPWNRMIANGGNVDWCDFSL
jgi:hypothetical protein